jgi:hypothetical protein
MSKKKVAAVGGKKTMTLSTGGVTTYRPGFSRVDPAKALQHEAAPRRRDTGVPTMTDYELSSLLGEAQAAIGADGELSSAWRRRIWQVFVDRMGVDAAARAWGQVQVACAYRAWPIWRATFPDEDEPMAVLRSVEKRLAAGRATGDAEARIAKLKADLDNKFLLGPEYFAGIYGGFGCFAAASELLHRREPPDGNELEVDPIEWDASFFASLAHAGGAVWEEGDGNPEARRAYWQWFLTDPVPRFGPT